MLLEPEDAFSTPRSPEASPYRVQVSTLGSRSVIHHPGLGHPESQPTPTVCIIFAETSEKIRNTVSRFSYRRIPGHLWVGEVWSVKIFVFSSYRTETRNLTVAERNDRSILNEA